MVRRKTDKPRGILNPKAAPGKFHHAQYLPSPDLGFFIEHYWSVKWDLKGKEPQRQEVLSHPSVHLVFEQDQAQIFGVVRGRFSRLLEGKGRVLGVKFKPGAFYPFLKAPVSGITDRTLSSREVFGRDIEPLEEAILPREDDEERIELVERFLRERLPARDKNIELIQQVIERILADREITRVDDVVDRLHLNKRTLQRIFSQYVGVSPKWVIRRYRLHEAAERLANGEIADLAGIALDLGYFDQAHFIKDFKAVVGQPPAEYAAGCAARLGR